MSTIEKTKYSHIINKNMLSECPSIIDGGACVGNFADIILEFQKNSKIFLIEPCKSNVEILKEKFFNIPAIKIYEAVLAGDGPDKEVDFNEFVGMEEWGNAKSLYLNTSPKPSLLKEIIKYKVNTVNINNLIKDMAAEGIKEVDYMKLDVEGYEQEIIRAMYLHGINNVKQISMEIHCNVDVYYIEEQLKGIGYKTIVYCEGELYASMERL